HPSGFRRREVVHVTHGQLMAYVKVRQSSHQPQIAGVHNIQTESKSARVIYCSPKGISSLQGQAETVALSNTYIGAGIQRVSERLAITDTGKTGVDTIQSPVEQVSLEAVHVVGHISLASA